MIDAYCSATPDAVSDTETGSVTEAADPAPEVLEYSPAVTGSEIVAPPAAAAACAEFADTGSEIAAVESCEPETVSEAVTVFVMEALCTDMAEAESETDAASVTPAAVPAPVVLENSETETASPTDANPE